MCGSKWQPSTVLNTDLSECTAGSDISNVEEGIATYIISLKFLLETYKYLRKNMLFLSCNISACYFHRSTCICRLDFPKCFPEMVSRNDSISRFPVMVRSFTVQQKFGNVGMENGVSLQLN